MLFFIKMQYQLSIKFIYMKVSPTFWRYVQITLGLSSFFIHFHSLHFIGHWHKITLYYYTNGISLRSGLYFLLVFAIPGYSLTLFGIYKFPVF